MNPKRDGQPKTPNKEIVKMAEIKKETDETAAFEALKKKLAAKPKPDVTKTTGEWYQTDNGNWRILYSSGKNITVFKDKESLPEEKWKILYKLNKTTKPEVDPELYKDAETAKKIAKENFDSFGGTNA